MLIKHRQLIGWNYTDLSARIGMCRKKNLPKLMLKGKNMGEEGIKQLFMWVHTSSIQCLCTYIRSCLASFLHLHCGQLASLYCYPSLGYWCNKMNSFLGECCRLFGLQIMKHKTSTNNSELILGNKWFSYLPTNSLDKLEEVSGDSIANKGSILYTKSILHTRPNSRA